jgi:hypothetical protein
MHLNEPNVPIAAFRQVSQFSFAIQMQKQNIQFERFPLNDMQSINQSINQAINDK